ISRTLVPTLVRYLLRGEAARHEAHAGEEKPSRFDRAFARLRTGYGRYLAWALANRAFVAIAFVLFAGASVAMLPLVGRDFFPQVDAGLIKLHVRGAPGTRLEESEKRIARIEDTIRTVIPKRDIDTMLDVMGIPYSGINLSLSEGALISSADAQIFIALKPGHRPTAEYMRSLRETLHKSYPETTFFFLAPDISTQVLNFGLAAPIDLQVVGPIGSEDQSLAIAEKLAEKVAKIPGAVDVHLAQESRVPQLQVAIDRVQAQQA